MTSLISSCLNAHECELVKVSHEYVSIIKANQLITIKYAAIRRILFDEIAPFNKIIKHGFVFRIFLLFQGDSHTSMVNDDKEYIVC